MPNAHNPQAARAVPPPPANPTRADQIQNIDQVKTAIKAYYGDTVSGTNPDGSPQHLPSATSAYANELHGIEARADAVPAPGATTTAHGQKAIVLDVDDTSLNTYNYEIFSNFVYNPTSNADLRQRRGLPGRLRHAAAGELRGQQGLQGLLPDRPPGVPAGRDRGQPDQGRASR